MYLQVALPIAIIRGTSEREIHGGIYRLPTAYAPAKISVQLNKPKNGMHQLQNHKLFVRWPSQWQL